MDIPAISSETAERFRRKSCGEEGNGENRRRQTKIRDSRANLKKVLALVLAFACAFTMFAGAAFTDSADIKATEAVDMLTALGVIDGFEDGSFQPNGTVTRAQMAKMIYVARTGNSNADSYASTPTTFTDITGHWAAGYIKYCQANGIIAGKSATKFCPNDNVTGIEAAKMLLVTAGYKADKEGLVGSAWANKTLGLAEENSLLDDVNTSLASALPRQYAAQIIYNALDMDTVKYEDGEVVKNETTKTEMKQVPTYNASGAITGYNTIATTVTENETVGEKYLKLVTDEDLILDSMSYDDNKDQYSFLGYSKIKGDYSSLMGQKVKVLHEKNKTDKVFGVYADPDSKVVATAICDDLDTVSGSNEKIKVDGTEYKTEGTLSSVEVRNFNQAAVAGYLNNYIGKAAVAPFLIKLIDNNDNGKIDGAVVTPFTVNEVTYVGSTSITLKGIGSVDKDDIIADEDLAKDDYAIVVAAANSVQEKREVSKVDVVTGTVESVKKTNTVKVDGTWYKKAGTDELTDADLNSKVELQVVNGFYFAAEVVAADADAGNVLYISAADAKETKLGDVSVKAKAYFTDGSDKEITVVEVNDKDIDAETVQLSGNVPDATNYGAHRVVVGMLYRYETKKNGDYKLFALSDNSSKDRAGYKKYAAATNGDFNKDTKRLTAGTSFTIADDAAVFVQAENAVSGDKVKVITGKALKKWSNTSSLYAQVLANETNGTKNAKIVKLVYAANTAISGATDDSYGFVTATPIRITNADGDKVWQYEIWNGTKTVTVFEDKSAVSAAKGDFIKYNIVSDTEVEDIANNVGSCDAVTAIDGDKIDTTSNTALGIDDKDTQVIYVNTKDTKGVEGGKIALADEPVDGVYTMNVYVVGATDGEDLDAIFVDVNNKIDGVEYSATVEAAHNKATVASVEFALAVKSGSASVEEGKTVTLTVTPSTTVAAGGAKLVVKCNETGKTQTVTFAAGADTTAQEVSFTQEAYNTTYSIAAAV